MNEIEKALQMPRILWQQTTIQSTNGSKFAASSSSLATVSVGGAKSVNASSSQTQKSQKLWQVLIGLGVGCFAVVIAAINQSNTKNPVPISPVENVPVAIPSPVTQIPEIPLTVKSQPTISPSTLHTSDKVETEQAQIEEIEKQRLQAASKVEQERQAAIRKEAAVRTAKEQLEAVIRERREMRQRREQLNITSKIKKCWYLSNLLIQ
ncbi:hypothetical protein [Nostoc sp.]|uniref:hypothetical protein n=1 Tax=Nostoc sp. TaxID=1180 RepID=UPI002FF97915